ncbi:hypothetical protein, partial [Streptomyces lavendulae]
RYRVTWKALAEAAPTRLSGTWLVAVPEALTGPAGDTAAAVLRTLAERGAEVRTLTIAAGAAHREALTAAIEAATGGDTAPEGVL